MWLWTNGISPKISCWRGRERSTKLFPHKEIPLTLEVPQSLTLADGTTALVRAVAARVVDGRLDQIVYTVEKESGAWEEVTAEALAHEVHP